MEHGSYSFGNLVAHKILEPFKDTHAKLKEQAQSDPETMALLEIADAITYDESTARFHQVYKNVPVPGNNTLLTVRIAMSLQEVHTLTECMAKHIGSDHEGLQ